MVSRELEGRTALVVGAGPGIGRSCALAFGAAGARVVVAARRWEPLEELAGEVARETGAETAALAVDLADVSSCTALIDATVSCFGSVDAMVCVATTGGTSCPIADADWDLWRSAFQINVIGTMEVSRAATRAMAANGGGSIVHVSTFGTHALPEGLGAYTATKQAAVAASKTFAKEVARSGVRVNVVTPGFVAGDKLFAMFAAMAQESGESVDDVVARMSKSAALERLVDPSDIADAVLFLCSQRSAAITGVELPVTAGQPPL